MIAYNEFRGHQERKEKLHKGWATFEVEALQQHDPESETYIINETIQKSPITIQIGIGNQSNAWEYAIKTTEAEHEQTHT